MSAMDVDPMEMSSQAQEAAESKSRLNAMVAVTIALVATFMGVCKVKDDNICQSMQQAQANKIDGWNYYQAKNTQQKVYEVAAAQLRVQALGLPQLAQPKAEKEVAALNAKAKDENEKKADLKTKAEGYDKEYDGLNYRDDQFDLSDTLMALSISLLAMTSLTQKKWLYIVALVPTALGVIMGLAGLFGWKIHPDVITNLLS